MAAPTVKTKTPGIYKRGGRYVIVYRVNKKQRYEAFRTLDEARRAKAARTTDVSRGEFQEESRATLHEYALDWVERYQGNGRHAIRPATRDEYRRQLKQYALRYFGQDVRLTELTPSTIAKYGEWLRRQTKPAPTSEDKDRRLPLSNETVKRVMAPLQACLGTAVQDGVLRYNPARGVKLPAEARVEDDEEEQVKPMSREELATLSEVIPEAWRLFFWVLTATGLRISEAVALGVAPPAARRVARACQGPPGAGEGAPGAAQEPLRATRHPARSRPRRRAARTAQDDRVAGDKHPVFPAGNGSPLLPANVFRRVLIPAREEACLPWVGFHTFRHTCATLLFSEGRNVKQVQRWLGHHKASFTLDTYIGLLDEDLGEPLPARPGCKQSANTSHRNRQTTTSGS